MSYVVVAVVMGLMGFVAGILFDRVYVHHLVNSARDALNKVSEKVGN